MIVNDPNDQSFDKAIELDPDSGLVYVKRAGIWSAKRDRAKMQQDLDDAIKRSPEDPETLAAKAWLLATSDHRNVQQALADAKQACELTRYHSPECLAPLAAAYAESGDFDQAVKRQKEALALLPPAARAAAASHLKLYEDRKPR